jgi:hypothetical protein
MAQVHRSVPLALSVHLWQHLARVYPMWHFVAQLEALNTAARPLDMGQGKLISEHAQSNVGRASGIQARSIYSTLPTHMILKH